MEYKIPKKVRIFVINYCISKNFSTFVGQVGTALRVATLTMYLESNNIRDVHK